MLTYFLFVLGFPLLIKGADFLVRGASLLAERLKVPQLLIGLTIVAFGTSAPELFVNILASIRGNSEIAIGNILGSNIFNILVILGISAMILPLSITQDVVWKEIPLCLLASILVGVLGNDGPIDGASVSSLSRTDGLVLMAFFTVFMYHLLYSIKDRQDEETQLPRPKVYEREHGVFKIVMLIVVGLGFLFMGSRFVVRGAVELALRIGVSQSLIALTIVSLGTSIPELVTSVVAAVKKNPDIAVGNIVGSNIFNIFFILGISACIRPLPFMIRSDTVDVAVNVGASLVLFLMMFTGRRYYLLERWEGALFLAAYGGYLSSVIVRG